MKKKLPWIIAASAVVLIGIAAAIVLPQVFRTPEVPKTAAEETESETEPGESLVYDGILYWNVDRLTYAGKSETGMSSRVPEKEDGLYHILFAENGRQVERRTADKRLVNMIDSYDVMGLRFDENRLITEVIPITKIIDEFSINGLYVKTVLENGQFELNTSETLEARQNIVLDLTGYQVYDVSGVSKNFVGQPIGIAGLQMRDRIFGIEMPDGSKIIYVTDRFVEIPIYWNVERQYNSAIKATTREPNEDGDYVYLFAINGEQVELKTKILSVANSIDARAAMCMSLELDGEGYIKKSISPSSALHGGTWGSWATVTKVIGNQIFAKKLAAGSDQGKEWEGVLSENVKVFDCSVTAEFVGKAVDDLKRTDVVHCLTDADGEIVYVFIVSRLYDGPIYWNQTRKYDTSKKETTRTPDADGWYWFDMCANGGPVRLKTNDRAIATKVDSYAAKCMGLVVEGDVIVKTLSASGLVMTGGGTAGSWHHVMSKNGNVFHVKKTIETASDYLHEADVTMAANCKVYNVSKNYTYRIGEETTLQVGDQVHCLTNMDGEAAVVFVISRTMNLPIYWNVDRKYDSATGKTTRTKQADGLYHFVMATDGKQVELVTDSEALATEVDSKAARCMGILLSGNRIVRVVFPSSVFGYDGGVAASWCDVTKVISSTKFHTKRTLSGSTLGKEEDITMAADCKVYNVSNYFNDFVGERTTVQVGDRVHVLLNKSKQATIVYIVNRDAPSTTGVCPECGTSVTWKGFTGTISGEAGTTVHYYLLKDTTIASQSSVPEGVICHFDFNGHDLIYPDNARGLTTFNENSSLVLMNTKYETDPSTLIAGTGTQTGNYGTTLWVRQTDNELKILNLMIDGSRAEAEQTRGLIYVSRGKLTLQNVTIIGAKRVKSGAAIYTLGETVLENVTITGGVSDQFGSVVVAGSGTLTLKGDVRISGGKLSNGTNANIYLESGRKITLPLGLTSPAGSIGVTLEAPGPFTESGNAASLQVFFADSGESVRAEEDGTLAIGEAVAVHEHVEGTHVQILSGTGETHVYEAWTKTDAIPLSSGWYYLTADVTLTNVKQGILPANADVHLCLNGHRIVNATEPCIQTYALFNEGCALSITDCSEGETGIVESTGSYASMGKTVWVRYGTFNLYGGTLKGSESTPSTTSKNGGGTIYVRSGSVANIYGGTITGGTATASGGNVVVANGATLRMFGGTITGGTAGENGGNVAVSSGGIFQMSGGTITGGTATMSGGNVNVATGGTFQMTGGTLTGGTAGEKGGNLMTDGASGAESIVVLENVTISGGTATGLGGNVFAKADSFTATGVTLENGKSSDYAGNICVSGKNVVLRNIVLKNGKGKNVKGADLYMNNKSSTLLLDGIVTEGSVWLRNATKVTLSGTVKLGTASNIGLELDNASYNANLTSGGLSEDSKIYMRIYGPGTIVAGGASVIDRFVLSGSDGYRLQTNGDDIEVVEDTEPEPSTEESTEPSTDETTDAPTDPPTDEPSTDSPPESTEES